MLSDFGDLATDDLSGYAYDGTVVVEGDLHRYLKDLERYFSKEWSSWMVVVNKRKENLRELRECGKRYEAAKADEKRGLFFLGTYGTPAEVDSTNYLDAITWLERDVDCSKRILRSQLLNHGKVAAILRGERLLEELDMMNYGHANYVVHLHMVQDSLKMDVFTRSRIFTCGEDKKQRFANRARSVGVDARIIREEPENDVIPLGSYLATGKLKRDTQIVTLLPFEVGDGDVLTYALHLDQAERQMLGMMDYGKTPAELYAPTVWCSPHHARKVVKNLLGVAGVSAKKFLGQSRWDGYFIPRENKDAVHRALSSNVPFWKEYVQKDLPALHDIAERTAWLERTYGMQRPPFFTAQEVGRRLGWGKGSATEALENLTGVLAAVDEEYVMVGETGRTVSGTIRKWFLPHARCEMAGEMLEQLE